MPPIALALIIVGAVALDQIIKYVVVATMTLGQAIELLPFLALLHARNEGIAFSMFAGFEGWTLAILSAGVLLFVLWLWRSTPRSRAVAQIGFALIVGGAIGNLIDRVWLGYVVDYVYFHTPVWSFAVFNLADACISVGAACVIVDEFVLEWWRKRRTGRVEERGEG